MNNHTKNIILLVLCSTILVYLVFAFVTFYFNPTHWTYLERVTATLTEVFFVLLVLHVYYDEDEEIETPLNPK